ncbi:expressed unknown protein [Seminavis robusta]|uniref:Uncharacterized protein n=1 Tax=Seminavis robusta TaxID=568900 RepID=A0A9N8EAE7_9STRA|nr:expressed unknown protein [Seminavis robusta]|eukprot:Sro726_g193430.1 n/a (324) ;mRNA; f:12754-13725
MASLFLVRIQGVGILPAVFLVLGFLRASAALTPIEPKVKSLSDLKIDPVDPLVPLASTVLVVPDENLARDVVFVEKAVNQRIEGLEDLQRISRYWDRDFESSQSGVAAAIRRASALSSDVAVVCWNVTWVPPTTEWLANLGKLLEPRVETKFVAYNHLAGQPSTFSWRAVFKLFEDVVNKGVLCVPLACIEGTTTLQYSKNSKVIRITEDLAYAEDLRRGALQNRKCAQDLRLFLEAGRRLQDRPSDWDDSVATSLPWSTVAGSNPLDVDPVEEGPSVAIAFVGIVFLSLLVFASAIAPQLIGQSLFGPPNYIVSPEELKSIY